jgi:hypothetical protein
LCCAAEIIEYTISMFENRVLKEVYVSRRKGLEKIAQ